MAMTESVKQKKSSATLTIDALAKYLPSKQDNMNASTNEKEVFDNLHSKNSCSDNKTNILDDFDPLSNGTSKNNRIDTAIGPKITESILSKTPNTQNNQYVDTEHIDPEPNYTEIEYRIQPIQQVSFKSIHKNANSWIWGKKTHLEIDDNTILYDSSSVCSTDPNICSENEDYETTNNVYLNKTPQSTQIEQYNDQPIDSLYKNCGNRNQFRNSYSNTEDYIEEFDENVKTKPRFSFGFAEGLIFNSKKENSFPPDNGEMWDSNRKLEGFGNDPNSVGSSENQGKAGTGWFSSDGDSKSRIWKLWSKESEFDKWNQVMTEIKNEKEHTKKQKNKSQKTNKSLKELHDFNTLYKNKGDIKSPKNPYHFGTEPSDVPDANFGINEPVFNTDMNIKNVEDGNTSTRPQFLDKEIYPEDTHSKNINNRDSFVFDNKTEYDLVGEEYKKKYMEEGNISRKIKDAEAKTLEIIKSTGSGIVQSTKAGAMSLVNWVSHKVPNPTVSDTEKSTRTKYNSDGIKNQNLVEKHKMGFNQFPKELADKVGLYTQNKNNKKYKKVEADIRIPENPNEFDNELEETQYKDTIYIDNTENNISEENKMLGNIGYSEAQEWISVENNKQNSGMPFDYTENFKEIENTETIFSKKLNIDHNNQSPIPDESIDINPNETQNPKIDPTINSSEMKLVTSTRPLIPEHLDSNPWD
ncbi:hypothetical protein BB558_003906 [Smittium angustum]|uniref:Uncharacterized protein n=1 Tax=Smittium angustum TaxID=133377 RepID=A0A2U1J547_SMIAN|nr:hypothetical protein BB558_003906 [Smittium angustum]